VLHPALASTSDDLSSTVGIVAIAAGAVALLALALMFVLIRRLRTLRTAQRVVLGESGQRDVVAHAERIQAGFDELRAAVDSTFSRLDERLTHNERRLGRQSSSMALLDDSGTGVVLSSILHREQARMYVKDVRDGHSEFELSPEENEAIATALGR